MYTIKEKKILSNNPFIGNQNHRKEILKKINYFLKNNSNYILGSNVVKFEKDFAKFINSKYCVGVNNGTDAIFLGLKSLGIKKDDEIILPSHTASATLSAVVQSGAKPIFVDINVDTYTLDLISLQKLINKKTKAIIVVHLYGQCAIDEKFLNFINKLSIPIIEDCAQSFGTSFKRKLTGTFGKIGCFSFYPTKNLGALGDAGAIITDNIKVYSKLLKLRQYGWNNDKVSIMDGYNTRIDEIQSLILRIKLKYLKKNISKKNTIAKLYNEELSVLPILTPKLKKNIIHSFHLYVIRVNASVRNKLIKFLESKKIFCSIHYKIPLHKMPIAKKYVIKSDLKNTNKIVNEIISLPMYAELKKYEVIYIIKQIKLFYSLNK